MRKPIDSCGIALLKCALLMLEFNPSNHSFTLDGLSIPSVTRVLAPLYDGGSQSPTYQAYMELGRRRGTAVHEATEDHDRQAWRPTDPMAVEIAPYLTAWQAFLSDTGFEIHSIEEQVCSYRHRYAGILDRLGVLNGRRVVIDIKTGSSITPMMGVQLAAYQAAVNEEKPKAEQYPYRFICQLRNDSTYRLQEFRDRSDLTVFLALLTLHNWRSLHGNQG